MNKIEVKILEHNCNNMPAFLARLTQRGHKINSMADLLEVYDSAMAGGKKPSSALMSLPHSTIRRMCYITVAITGLSTKCVSQLRTHAKRLTFISTSTQYSSFEGRDDNYVIPDFGDDLPAQSEEAEFKAALADIQDAYDRLIDKGVDKDKAGYLLPQGLRKALVISGPLDAWQYVLSLRTCKRNTEETQKVCWAIYNAIKQECGDEFVVGMLPGCLQGGCKEGKFSCGKPYKKEDIV